MKNSYILAIDQGTTGTTAIVFDFKDPLHPQIVGKARQEFKQHYPYPGWVEHDLEEIFASVRQAVLHAASDAKQRHPSFELKSILACGLTNQRETICVFERGTARALSKALVWQCKRSKEICEDVRREGLESWLTEKTGLVCDPYFSASKIRWIMESLPDVAKKLNLGHGLLGTIDSFLIYKMSDAVEHKTEASNASRTLLYDLKTGAWDDDLCRLFKVPSKDVLPQIQDSSGFFAKTKGLDFLPDGIPIYGVLGDQQAALAGQGCIAEGMAKCTYGTGAFLLLNLGQKLQLPPKKGLLTTVAWQINKQRTYACEGSAFIAGAAVQFLRDQLGLINQSSETYELAKDAYAAPELYFVPALSGLGAPYWIPSARGAFLGLTRGTGKKELARACLEGIAFQVGDLMLAMGDGQIPSDFILRVDGGASANDLLCSIQSQFLRASIERPRIVDTTALGAALFAALGVGCLSDLSAIKNLHGSTWMRFDPDNSQECKAETAQKWRGWRKAVEAVASFASQDDI